MASSRQIREAKAIGRASLFLAPNILGFIAFTLIPIVFSFGMAFTNWDLTLHNRFSDLSPSFVGFDNFVKLFDSPYFWQYLGNTFFLMLGIPLGIAGSLGAAVLLNTKLRGPNRGFHRPLFITTLSLASAALLLAIGLSDSAFVTLIIGVLGLMLVGGSAGGSTVYRTLFYLPHFTQGVAIFLLWKKLFNPQTGPINRTLQPMLDGLAGFVNALPTGMAGLLFLLPLILAGWLLRWWFRSTKQAWINGELGSGTLLCMGSVVGFALALTAMQFDISPLFTALLVNVGLAPLLIAVVHCQRPRDFPSVRFAGFGGHALAGGILTMALAGLFLVCTGLQGLPDAAQSGLEPPEWLTDYDWAKPSLILMGLWASIGGNNMILYLAGLSNISPDFYEAADIDGASRWQKFQHITWPQLAPVTFFIVVMSVIYGLQGGFEMAKTMTQGGPAGATTTLSYYIYAEGFETGRLGFASAVAWVLFLMVFAMSMFNWKFGNRYVSE